MNTLADIEQTREINRLTNGINSNADLATEGLATVMTRMKELDAQLEVISAKVITAETTMRDSSSPLLRFIARQQHGQWTLKKLAFFQLSQNAITVAELCVKATKAANSAKVSTSVLYTDGVIVDVEYSKVVVGLQEAYDCALKGKEQLDRGLTMIDGVLEVIKKSSKETS